MPEQFLDSACLSVFNLLFSSLISLFYHRQAILQWVMTSIVHEVMINALCQDIICKYRHAASLMSETFL